jgi:hypothetical protein
MEPYLNQKLWNRKGKMIIPGSPVLDREITDAADLIIGLKDGQVAEEDK